jgi:hypothetical protein
MKRKTDDKLQPIADKDAARSVDMLWGNIQDSYEQAKATNIGRLNSYKANPAPAGSLFIPEKHDTTIKPGITGLNHVQASSQLPMPTSSGHSSCTENPLLRQRAQKIIEDMQRQRQETLELAAESFLAGPLAWEDFPDYEDEELDGEEPWEPLPYKP